MPFLTLQGRERQKGDINYRKRSGGIERFTYVHEVLLHVVGKVLEHSHLAHKVFRNLACGEDRALAQLCIVMDGPEEINTELRNHSDKHYINGFP